MIASLGELLVEFLCETRDTGHRTAARYAGPYPSGAPGIFIDQAARIAGRAIFAGSVGADAFGDVILDRLRANGVDLALVGRVPDLPTGTAHVAYNSDGSRDFVFNISASAAARLPPADVIARGFAAAGVTMLHVSGSALGDPGMRATIMAVTEGFAVSVDPNIRPELMRDAGYLAAVRALVGRAEIVLPSDADAAHLWPGEGFDDWSARLLAGRARVVVLKRGAEGCIGRGDDGAMLALPAHAVDVLDPTGAGDCFCATFVAETLGGADLSRALRRANAAGAMAVQAIGPMEGNAGPAAIDAFLEHR